MRDPFSWSLSLGRVFGIPVRMHILFPMFMLAVILRVAANKDYESGLWLEAVILLAILVFIVLFHELGHCFGARLVEGDAHEILMWPLGGLAFVEVPHTWRAHFVSAAAGPAVNIILCVVSGTALALSSLWPPLNPTWDPFRPVLYNSSDELLYGSKFGLGDAVSFRPAQQDGKPLSENAVSDSADLVAAEGTVLFRNQKDPTKVYVSALVPRKDLAKMHTTHEVVLKDRDTIRCRPFELTGWQTFLARFFFINWALTLLNVICVGFPLDGGQMLQAVLWRFYGYRQAMLYAIFAGFIITLLTFVWSAWINDMFPFLLGCFIAVTCWQKRVALEHGGEEGMFGYDFSQGYTSLERDAPARPPRRRRPGFIKRWLQARAAKRMQRQAEEREAEERRMDALLEKVKEVGMQGLTDEERRFLLRVSDRYRNRN